MAIQQEASGQATLPPNQVVGHTKRVLAYIDEEAASEAIVHWLRECMSGEPAPEVVLLAVMPRPDDVKSRGIFIDKVRAHLMETGRQRLENVDHALTAAGLAQGSGSSWLTKPKPFCAAHVRRAAASL